MFHTKTEVLSNTLWRFLQLREYVDDKHVFTKWGAILFEIMKLLDPEADPDSRYDESALIAVELLRYDLLNAEHMFGSYVGAPLRGSGKFASFKMAS